MEIEILFNSREFHLRPGFFTTKTNVMFRNTREYYGYSRSYELYWLWFHLIIIIG